MQNTDNKKLNKAMKASFFDQREIVIENDKGEWSEARIKIKFFKDIEEVNKII